MQLVDRIEKRRFVGREFLLWLWFESEVFDATLHTKQHGSFGLWLEKRLALSDGKQSTKIVSPSPGFGRIAKEALLAGQLPESAGIRIAVREEETGFVLKAESLAVAGLKLRTVLNDKDSAPTELMKEVQSGGRHKSKKKRAERDDEAHEAFYERMQLTTEFEEVLEALYQVFRELRLGPAWSKTVVPLMQAWARGEEVDCDAYAALKGMPARSTESVVAAQLH